MDELNNSRKIYSFILTMREALNALFSIDPGNFNAEIRPAECFTLSVNPSGFACGKCNYILRSIPDTLLHCPFQQFRNRIFE